MVSYSNHVGLCAREGRHLVIELLEQDIVAIDDARHVGDKAVIAKVAFPALLDKVIGIGEIAEMSDEVISAGQGMSEKSGRLVEEGHTPGSQRDSGSC